MYGNNQTGEPEHLATSRAALWSVILWAIALLAITAACAAWLNSTGSSYSDFSPAILLIAYSPAYLAVAVALLIPRAGGIRQLTSGLLRWRAGAGWYALALLGPFVIVLVTTAVFVAFGHRSPQAWMVLPGSLAFLGPLIAGSIGEELGWRGFAQRRLQRRYAAVTVAVFVGLLWALWHLWPLLTPAGQANLTTMDVVLTVVRLVSTSIIYAWLYNSTGSLGLVLVAHMGHNLAVDLAAPAVLESGIGAAALAGIYALGAVAVLIVTDPRTLTGARNRHQTSLEEQ